MRKGERSKVMVKPAWGFAMPEHAESVKFPPGWETGEKRLQLLNRRAFFEITLHDFVIRHDLDGDGKIFKTIHERGFGFDRPGLYDEIRIDLKIYQNDKVFVEIESVELLMTNHKIITPLVAKVLKTMKEGEKITAVISPSCV